MTTAIQELMKNVNGSTFIGIDTETPVALKGGKANPYQGRVSKVVIGSSVMVFQNKTTNAYENMVNRRLAKEGKAMTFKVGPRPWGERLVDTPFVVHKGVLYLEVIFLKDGDRHFMVNGERRDNIDDIQGYEGDSEETANQGGVSDKVVIRTYKVANIKRITINGTTYNL